MALSFSGKAYARVGLLGNPSDGFNGKTLSFELKNFHAEATVRVLPGSSRVVIHPHPVLDTTSFDDFSSLSQHTNVNGYHGGIRLVQAALVCFQGLLRDANLESKIQGCGFEVMYNTNIPRMVGLSGSSAIIVATLRALMAFAGVTLDDLLIRKENYPQIVLDIERKQLGISAGLQDRVIQTYGGLVFMDFSPERRDPSTPGSFYPLNPCLLPKLYLIYDVRGGGDSGQVHSTVKERWARRDPALVAGMQTLGTIAEAGKLALETNRLAELAELMSQNFALRCEMYGEDVVGKRNLDAIARGSRHRLACKFTGSGGALVAMRTDGTNEWLPSLLEENLRQDFQLTGFRVERICPLL